MKIVIIGGSNSLVSDGYVDRLNYHLSNLLKQNVQITNLSVGGSTMLSGLCRLFELLEPPDIIVLEYSLNDVGHLEHRDCGYMKIQFLDILYAIVINYFPSARIVSLLLASRPYYDLKVFSDVYDKELKWYNDNGVDYVDVREILYSSFGFPPPNIIYSDDAHYHRGCIVSLIGTLLAERIFCIYRENIRSFNNTGKNYVEILGNKYKPIFVGARELHQENKIGIGCSIVSNRHIETNVFDLELGEKCVLNISGFPVALALVSTTQAFDVSFSYDTFKCNIATRYCSLTNNKLLYTTVPFFEFFPLQLIGREGLLGFEIATNESDTFTYVFDNFVSLRYSPLTFQFDKPLVHIAGILILQPI